MLARASWNTRLGGSYTLTAVLDVVQTQLTLCLCYRRVKWRRVNWFSAAECRLLLSSDLYVENWTHRDEKHKQRAHLQIKCWSFWFLCINATNWKFKINLQKYFSVPTRFAVMNTALHLFQRSCWILIEREHVLIRPPRLDSAPVHCLYTPNQTRAVVTGPAEQSRHERIRQPRIWFL